MTEAGSAWLVWLALLVVLGLWMLGAYNRVTNLRAAILGAWAQVDTALAARGQALAELLALAERQLQGQAAEPDSLAQARAQLGRVADAADQARRRPTDAPAVAALASADAALQAFSLRLLALVADDAALGDDPPAQALLQALRDHQPRLDFARQMFNDAAQRYNDALQQFPTRLLMPVFRLAPAGQL